MVKKTLIFLSLLAVLAIPSYAADITPKPSDVAALKEKAQKGEAAAQNALGLLYVDGQGVGQDYAEAAKWFRGAAEQGNAAAQIHLGELYDSGLGVKQDYAEAYFWYSLVASKEIASFREHAAQATRHFTPEQIAALKKRIEAWKPTTALPPSTDTEQPR